MKKSTHLFFYTAVFTKMLLLISCKSDDLSPVASIEILSGNDQIGIQGEYISEPIVIKVNSTLPYDQLALYRQVGGAGALVADNYDISAGEFVLDENYEARVYLSLRCDLGDQRFNIAIKNVDCSVNQECPLIATTEVKMTAETSDSAWKRLCDFPRGRKISEYNNAAYTTNATDIRQTQSELLRSSNFKQWQPVATFGERIVDFDILSDGTFVLITSREVQFSADGVTWEARLSGLPAENEFKFPTQLLAEDSVIFVNYTETDISFNSNWFRSRDRGASWEPLTTPLSDFPLVRTKNGDLFGLENEFTDLIYRSTDSGNTWEELTAGGDLEGQIQQIQADDESNLFIVTAQTGSISTGNNNKLYSLSLPNLELTEEEIPVDVSYITSLSIYDGIPYLLSGKQLFRKNGSWELIQGPETNYPAVDGLFFPSGFDYLYVKGEGQYLLSSFYANTYSNFID